MGNSILSIRGLCKSYNNKLVLNNLDLEVEENDYVSIMGQSGAGKTTLLNIIALFENFTNGEYYLSNKLINSKSKYNAKIRLKNFGFIFQSYNLIGKLSVKDNILLPTIYTDDKKDYENECYRLAKRLKIDVFLDKQVDLLSGGEKQRVAIARALILSPKIIIADEPTGNLDDDNTSIVLDIIDEINKNSTVIIVTHNKEVAKRANKQYIIKNGKIINGGIKDEKITAI